MLDKKQCALATAIVVGGGVIGGGLYYQQYSDTGEPAQLQTEDIKDDKAVIEGELETITILIVDDTAQSEVISDDKANQDEANLPEHVSNNGDSPTHGI